MVTVWGLRLAGYLYRRILHMGHDARFDAMRPDAWLRECAMAALLTLPGRQQ